MADVKSIALVILRKRRMDVNTDTIDEMITELESCMKGRKVQILLILEKEIRLTAQELANAMKILDTNLAVLTNRLKRNLLIDKYDESDFKSGDDPINLKPIYHSITDLGRQLITDLGK